MKHSNSPEAVIKYLKSIEVKPKSVVLKNTSWGWQLFWPEERTILAECIETSLDAVKVCNYFNWPYEIQDTLEEQSKLYKEQFKSQLMREMAVIVRTINSLS